MPKRKPEPHYQHGLFKIYGFTINLNTIITTILGSICCLLLTFGLKWIGQTNTAVTKTLPVLEQNQTAIQADVVAIKKEQDRFRHQYAPAIK